MQVPRGNTNAKTPSGTRAAQQVSRSADTHSYASRRKSDKVLHMGMASSLPPFLQVAPGSHQIYTRESKIPSLITQRQLFYCILSTDVSAHLGGVCAKERGDGVGRQGGNIHF